MRNRIGLQRLHNLEWRGKFPRPSNCQRPRSKICPLICPSQPPTGSNCQWIPGNHWKSKVQRVPKWYCDQSISDSHESLVDQSCIYLGEVPEHHLNGRKELHLDPSWSLPPGKLAQIVVHHVVHLVVHVPHFPHLKFRETGAWLEALRGPDCWSQDQQWRSRWGWWASVLQSAQELNEIELGRTFGGMAWRENVHIGLEPRIENPPKNWWPCSWPNWVERQLHLISYIATWVDIHQSCEGSAQENK